MNKIEITRRDFLKGTTMVGGFIIFGGAVPLLTKANDKHETPTVRFADVPAEGHYWRFVIDITKCIGCGRCVKACKLENKVPMEPEYNRTWVERYVVDENDNMFVDSPNAGINGFAADYMNAKYKNIRIAKSFFVPKLCQHCDKPPCLPVCPVGANYLTAEGVVLVDKNACIGCRYCIQACPYGARYFHPEQRVVDKCSWCYHRITKGLLPACVEVCPQGARMFGDIRDPNSTVSKAIKEHAIGVLKPEVGCINKAYYIGLEKGVR